MSKKGSVTFIAHRPTWLDVQLHQAELSRRGITSGIHPMPRTNYKRKDKMGEWKNDRAEQAMRENDKEMMAKAAEKAQKELDAAWDDIKSELFVGSKPDDDMIEYTIDRLRDKYELPKKLKND